MVFLCFSLDFLRKIFSSNDRCSLGPGWRYLCFFYIPCILANLSHHTKLAQKLKKGLLCDRNQLATICASWPNLVYPDVCLHYAQHNILSPLPRFPPASILALTSPSSSELADLSALFLPPSGRVQTAKLAKVAKHHRVQMKCSKKLV